MEEDVDISAILPFGIGMPRISAFGMLMPGMPPPCGMVIPSMLCARAGATMAMASNAEISNGAFAIPRTVEAAMAKREAKIPAKGVGAPHPKKEKGRVQNTRPFLRS
jgi:hypothetical protein